MALLLSTSSLTIGLPINGPSVPFPLTIAGTPEPATVNRAYSFQPAVVGGSGARSFAIAGPALPAGLVFSAQTGAITGTPTTPGSVNGISISVTDSTGTVTLTGISIAVLASQIVVGTTAALADALAGPVAIYGGSILLMGSTPFSITTENVASLQRVVISSYDTGAPSTIDVVGKAGSTGGALAGWKNVTIDGVNLDRTALSYTAKAQYVPNVHLNLPDGVRITNNTMKGRATARFPGNTNPDNVVLAEPAIRLISPKNCRVEGNGASGYSSWLQSTGDGQDNNVVTGNTVKKGQKDYIQIIGGGNGLTITLNDLSDFYGSINEYQTDTGNHDDPIQISTSGSLTGWDNIVIDRNMIDGGGKDPPQTIFVKDEDQKGIRGLSIQNNAGRGSQANGIGVNANNGPGISLTVAYNAVIWSAVPHDPVDPQIANAKPGINLLNGCTGTCANNIASSYSTTGSTVTSSGNVTINYTTPLNALYAGTLFPGSLATGVDKYRIREARLDPAMAAGPDILKRALPQQAGRLAGLASGQSNSEYFFNFSRFEFEAALNDLAPSDVSYIYANGATEGSALLDVNKPARETYYWWNETAGTPGPRYDKWSAAVDDAVAGGRRIDFTIWNQGEGDAFFIGATDAQATRYFNALQLLFTLMRSKVPGLRIFISPMNRRDGDTSAIAASYVGGVEKLRDFHASFCAANPGFMTLLPEMYDQPGDGGAHATDAGYDALALRFARKISKVYGRTVTGGVDGPRLIAAVRSGTTVVFEFAHDGGTSLTPASDGQGLRYTANGTEIALSSVSVTDTTHITAILASTPAAGATEVAEFAYGLLGGIDYTKVVRDNQAVPLPVRHGKVTLTVNAGADTTAPTITSAATGNAANNTVYTKTLTANEAVTFSKLTGAQSATFTLSGTTLTLPAQTTAGTYVCNLRATDAAGNPTDFTHTVTVAAAAGAGIGGAWNNTLFNRRAATASGQTLPNAIASPADGVAQTAYDAILGSSTSPSTDDPTFTAAAGGVPAYFRNDGGDSIQTVSTDFLKKLSLDKSWSYGLLLKAPSVWTAGTVPVLFGAGANVSTNPGIQFRYVVNNNQIRVATADGSTGPSVNLTATLPTTGYIQIVATYDASTKTLTFYINSVTSLTIPSTAALNGGTAVSNFISGSALSDGAGWIEDVMASGIKTATDVANLRDYWETLYGIDIF